MTKSLKKSDKFKINLKNAVSDLATAMYAIDRKGLGYDGSDFEDAGSLIKESLKDIEKAVLLYSEDCDFIDLD